jgi:sec-independent protein translocase protein TatB
MLDIGFSELVVIGIVALVVVGPERLPRVARAAGHLLGRFQRYVSEVKADINREIELSELKRIQASVEEAARSIEQNVKSEMAQAQEELTSAEQQLRSAGAEFAKAGEAVEQTQAEINRAFATPHMGMGAGASAASTDPAPAGASLAQPATEEDPQRQPGAASEAPEPSPQLELTLPAQPQSAPEREPVQRA